MTTNNPTPTKHATHDTPHKRIEAGRLLLDLTLPSSRTSFTSSSSSSWKRPRHPFYPFIFPSLPPSAMSQSVDSIRTLLQSGSYAPSQVAPLEAYTVSVCQGNAPYVFDAIRTLLKLYQLFPSTHNATMVPPAFFLALAHYPSTDLLALTYLVPNPPPNLIKCGELLDACQFADFWALYDRLGGAEEENGADPILVSAIAKFRPQLQNSILSTLALAYKTIPMSVVTASCAVSTDNSSWIAAHPAVERVESNPDRVVFHPTSDNTKRERVFQEGIGFPALAHQLLRPH